MTTRVPIHYTILSVAARQNRRGGKAFMFYPGEPVLRALPFLKANTTKENLPVCQPC